jgi:anti-sigma factor RsiW
MTHILDELTLQRCVDGELSEVEQQQLLRQLERNPAGWREVALGFMEHQLWSIAGHEWVHDPAVPQVLPRETTSARTYAGWLRNTALMASTLLAIGLGYVGGSRSFWSSPSTPPVVQGLSHPGQLLGATTAMVSHQNDQSPAPDLIEPPSAASNSAVVPVYDAELLRQYGDRLMPRLSVEDRQHLKDQGYQIREEPGYYTVPIDNNRHLVVPINTVHVRQRLQ